MTWLSAFLFTQSREYLFPLIAVSPINSSLCITHLLGSCLFCLQRDWVLFPPTPQKIHQIERIGGREGEEYRRKRDGRLRWLRKPFQMPLWTTLGCREESTLGEGKSSKTWTQVFSFWSPGPDAEVFHCSEATNSFRSLITEMNLILNSDMKLACVVTSYKLVSIWWLTGALTIMHRPKSWIGNQSTPICVSGFILTYSILTSWMCYFIYKTSSDSGGIRIHLL